MSRKGDGDTEDSRGLKRARLLEPPDGFTKSKPKTHLRTSTPRFASAFNPHDSPTPGLKSTSKVRRAQATSLAIPNHETVARPPMRTMRLPIPIYTSPPRLRPTINVPTPRRTTPLACHKPIPVLETPPDKPPTVLHRPPLPSIASSYSAPRATVPLTSLPPPPALVPAGPSSPLKDMHTIFTTRVARATDLRTDNGTAELASIFLHDQHPNITFQNDDENANVEEHRGILISPEKRTKGKGPKFMRNGLASIASSVLTRAYTSLSLWQKETEHHLLSSSSRRLTPDLRLLIIKILHIPHPPNANSKFPSTNQSLPGVALTRLLSPNPNPPLSRQRRIFSVLLSFTTPLSPQTLVRNPEDFAEGKEVHVWRPWQQVSLLLSAPQLSSYNMELDTAVFLDIGESVSDTALLCSRFLIIR